MTEDKMREIHEDFMELTRKYEGDIYAFVYLTTTLVAGIAVSNFPSSSEGIQSMTKAMNDVKKLYDDTQDKN